ncbi:MAG: carboxypeptidase-like regulatory domain-containing protein, partial [Armatimonadetes bacterium]|nr:carboxypeptidase-like regulatory domain-containing protein [Armatimonadota bacterium]
VLVSADNGGGSYATAGDGYYTLMVPNGWSGRVAPSRVGYSFIPAYQSYANVVSSQSDQNYTATRDACLISGYVRTADGAPIAFVKMNGLPGNPRTDAAGYYSAPVPLGWSGTVTPARWHGVGLCMYRYGFDVGREDPAAPGLPIFNSGSNVVAAGSETMFYNTIKSTMFQNPAPIPEMPWKTNSTTGYLFGQVMAALEPNDPIYQNWIYRAEVTATGPAPKADVYTEITDATGTYEFIDLPPGNYAITVTATGFNPASVLAATVTAGRATKVNVAVGPVIPPENYKTLAAANDPTQTPDGTVIGLNGNVPGRNGKAITSPTAALSDCIYVEETDRSSGLQVRPGATSPPVAEGDRAELIGIMTTVNGERVLNHGSVLSRTAGTPLGALGSKIQDLSRAPRSTALLVKIAGKVTDMSVGWFALSDGSGTIKVKCPGMVAPAKGLAVQVSGINALDPTERVIRERKQSDIYVLAKSVVTAPSGTIGAGLDLFSMPYVPMDPSPGTTLTGLNISGRLFRWDNASQAFIAYDPIQPVVFGSLCPYEGYALLTTAAGTISFEGIPIPTVDARISLPKKGWSLIANPFNTPILWDQYHVTVTDGNRTLSLPDACTAGWIRRIAFTSDNQARNFGYVGTGARGSRFDDSLRPWKAYWVATYQDGLALIILAGG